MIARLISGGQTGADRAALDLALERDIPHGGWCPRGRGAEDGPLPERYRLKETPGSQTIQRTEWNARDSDGTAIFTLDAELAGGSKRTAEFAERHGKPWLHVCRDASADPGAELRRFVEDHGIAVLNVAGPRASNAPGIYAWTREVLERALGAA